MLGGVLLEHYWWGSVFLLAVPVMAALLLLGPRGPARVQAPEAGRLDLVSAAMSLVAVLAVVFGLKLTAQDGFDGLAGAAILVGLVVGLLFVRRRLTLADPMIDLRLFQNTAFNAALAANLLGIFIAVGYFLFVAQYLQLVLGLSPLEAGLWSLPSAVGFIVGSNLAPRLLRRVRPAGDRQRPRHGGHRPGRAHPGRRVPQRRPAILAGASLVVSLGLAPVFTATTDLIVSSAPPERAGAASGISETGPSSAAPSASPSWAPSASPSTAASWPTPAAGGPPDPGRRGRQGHSRRRRRRGRAAPGRAGRGRGRRRPRGVHPGPPADGRPQRRGRSRHRRRGHGPAPATCRPAPRRRPPSSRPGRRAGAPSSSPRAPSRSSGRARAA